MKLAAVMMIAGALYAQPVLPIKLVSDWVKLPKGMYIGECSGVSVDKEDNVWVFHRGKAQVLKFDRTGKLLDAWEGLPVAASHGIKVDPEGNIWAVDVFGHSIKKFSRDGRILMHFGNAGNTPGDTRRRMLITGRRPWRLSRTGTFGFPMGMSTRGC